MADIGTICNARAAGIKNEFDPTGGARDLEVLTGDFVVTDQCFVRDEIRFINAGRLIFAPHLSDGRPRYYAEYFVVCRKLTIIGGNQPIAINPCGPGDPGQLYGGNNVITWQDRLNPATAGAGPSPFHAANGASFDRNHWADQGQGNNGAFGGDGAPGGAAPPGAGGLSAPNFSIVVEEVVSGVSGGPLIDHLTIDFGGQVGGKGGRGQNGGDGGDGMGGKNGETERNSWPSDDDCGSQPGNGGDGGNGGIGGQGGVGGKAGATAVLTTTANIASSPLVTGKVTFVNDGGSGGAGGLGGFGGKMGLAGRAGFTARLCGNAVDGQPGEPGQPVGIAVNGPGSTDTQGPNGAPGASNTVKFVPLTPNNCSDNLPLQFTLLSVFPASGARGNTVSITIAGNGFDPTPSTLKIAVTGLGVAADSGTATITTNAITCDLTIAPLAPTTNRDVSVQIGPIKQTLTNAFQVTN